LVMAGKGALAGQRSSPERIRRGERICIWIFFADNHGMKKKLWVIFAGPQQFNGPNHYIDKDGKTTDMGARAAKFSSWADAKSFFGKHNIRATCQIGQESFEDHEV